MAKLFKSALALGMAALLLFACAACGGGGKPEPTEPEITEDAAATQPEALDVVMTTGEDDTSEEPTSVDGTTTEATSTKPSDTTVDGTTTTAAPTTTVPGKPTTKAEIVDYFNAAYKKARSEKPGYTFQERTIIDKDGISSSKNWLQNVASIVLPIAESAFTKWTDPEVTAKGADHSGLPPYVDVDPKWIKSAACAESGGNYQIRLSLVDENVPELPKDNRNTIHGKMIDRGVFNWDAVIGGVEQIPVIKIEITKFACAYSGSYIDATVNKTTGAVVKVTTWCSCQADVIAKVPVFGELDASVPLANESTYTF